MAGAGVKAEFNKAVTTINQVGAAVTVAAANGTLP